MTESSFEYLSLLFSSASQSSSIFLLLYIPVKLSLFAKFDNFISVSSLFLFHFVSDNLRI